MRSLAFVAFVSIAVAQPSSLTFRHLTIDDGLSQNSINCIHQDRFGFLWLGTQDGLNRYDGYTFKAYHHEPGNPNSLGNSYVWAIHEDKDGIFWIGSFGGGLTRFDPSTETFSHFRHEKGNPRSLSNNHVFSIVEYPEGTLWLTTDDGVSKFDKKSGLISRYLSTPDNVEGLPTNHIAAIAVQEPNHLWVSANTALVKLNIGTGATEYFTADPGKGIIPLGFVQHLIIKENKLQIVCAAGLIEYDVTTNTSLLVIDTKKIGDGTLSFRRLLHDASGCIWIGTHNGLLLSDTRTNTLIHSVHEDGDERSLTHNHVLSLYQSRDGIVWVGTRDGLNNVYRIKENFQLIKRRSNRDNTLSHKVARLVTEDKKGILWIGTLDGLNAYDRQRDQFTIFQHDPKNARSLGSSYILSLLEDRKGSLWVGTRGGGLNKLTFSRSNLSDYAIKKFPGDGTGGLRSNSVFSILEDSKETIWVGTLGKGLAKLVSEKDGFKHYERAADGTGPSHSFVYSMFEDSFGNMWVGTPTGGLNLFDRESERFIYIRNSPDNPNSLSNNIVLSLHEDATHALWVGTSGGLNKLAIPLRRNLFQFFHDSVNVSADSLFVAYGRQNGFPNDVIYGILEDGNGTLWLSTNKGLVVFDARRKNPVVRTFDASDGLQNNEFNQNGYFKNRKGEMFFSGLDGVSFFHPDSIRGNPFVPPVLITDFKLFNESVPLAGFSSPDMFALQRAMYQTNTLELSFDHSVLSFDFAALNFIVPEKNRYRYIMEGFDKDWIEAGTKRSVTYTNLDPGTYTFRVKGSNNDGVWNEAGAAVAIIIPPPPWLSWYAYLVYAGIFAAAIAFVIRYRVKAATREIEIQAQIERAKTEEREVVRKQSSADFHDEAGHKLTKISLFTELARGESKNNSSLREYLNKIEEQTKELSSGMRDFIWVLDPKKESLWDTIHRLKDFGNSMFGYSDIDFVVKGLTTELNDVVLSMESRRALMMIFKEAMNNCMKYAAARRVELAVALKNGLLEIALTDDGKGFDVNAATNGYGMKTMKERAEKLGADLSIFASPGAGTTVRFQGNIPRLRG